MFSPRLAAYFGKLLLEAKSNHLFVSANLTSSCMASNISAFRLSRGCGSIP